MIKSARAVALNTETVKARRRADEGLFGIEKAPVFFRSISYSRSSLVSVGRRPTRESFGRSRSGLLSGAGDGVGAAGTGGLNSLASSIALRMSSAVGVESIPSRWSGAQRFGSNFSPASSRSPPLVTLNLPASTIWSSRVRCCTRTVNGIVTIAFVNSLGTRSDVVARVFNSRDSKATSPV